MDMSFQCFKRKPKFTLCMCVAGVLSLWAVMLAANRWTTGGFQFATIDSSSPEDLLALAKSSASSSSLTAAEEEEEEGKVAPSKFHRGQILLVTYGRSGSTFTSALISHHQDVFFTFEPLFVLQKKKNATNSLWENTFRQKSVDILNGFLTCDFTHLSGADFDNIQLRNSGQDGVDFTSCVRQMTPGFVHVGCFLQMLRRCNSKSVSLIKVIRFPVAWVVDMLEGNPKLKLLYLVRDPRAVLFSQARVFNTFRWPSEAQMASEFHCGLLGRDLVELEHLRVRFPDQVKVIRYENGAVNSVRYAQEIYAFTGLTFTSNTLNFVKSLTNTTERDPGPISYSIKRSNTIKVMNQWRYLSGYKGISVVDRVCGPLYSKLGYKTARSQRDLESERPLFGPPGRGKLFGSRYGH